MILKCVPRSDAEVTAPRERAMQVVIRSFKKIRKTIQELTEGQYKI